MKSSLAIGPLLVSAILASAARAEPTIVVTASGDCNDVELIGNYQLFEAAVRQRAVSQLMDSGKAAHELFPTSTKSTQALQEQTDLAYSTFYAGEPEHALKLLDDALLELRSQTPGARRWALTRRAELFRGLFLTFLGGKARAQLAEENFRHVLSLESKYKLDEQLFPPPVVAHFEKLRREITRARKARLIVKSSIDGAEVFLDGFYSGKTPLRVEVLPGTYQLIVVKGDKMSFARELSLRPDRESVETIDLTIEGSFHPSRGLCFSKHADPKLTRSITAWLTHWLGLRQTIVVTIDRVPSTGAELNAAIVGDDAREIRKGTLPLPGKGEIPDGLDDLADYLVSGKNVSNMPDNPVLSQQAQSALLAQNGLENTGWKLGVGGLIAVGVGTGLNLIGMPGSSYWSRSSDTVRTVGTVLYLTGAVTALTGAGILAWGLLHLSKVPAQGSQTRESMPEVGVEIAPGGGYATLRLELP